MKFSEVRIGHRFEGDVSSGNKGEIYTEVCQKLFTGVKVIRTGKIVESPSQDAEVKSVKS